MRVKNARSLIVTAVPQRADEEEAGNGLLSPFARFMAVLEKERPLSSEDGSIAAWTNFPLERAIASGLWLLIIGLAKRWNVKLTTDSSVAKVAERADLLVNAGLCLGFSSPEDAAASWERTVEKPIERAFVLGYRPGIELPLSVWQELIAGNEEAFVQALSTAPAGPAIGLDGVWQKPIALFFVEIVKICRRWISEIDDMLERFIKRNTIYREGTSGLGLTYVDEGTLRHADVYLRILTDADIAEGEENINGVPKRFFQEPMKKAELEYMFTQLPTIRPLIIEVADRVEFFRRLPHGFSAKDKGRLPLNLTVADDWLKTQILLAVGGHRDRNHISYREHLAALDKLRDVDDATVVKAVMARLGRRGMKLKKKDAARLSDEIVRCLSNDHGLLPLREWSTKPKKRSADDPALGTIERVPKGRRFLMDP